MTAAKIQLYNAWLALICLAAGVNAIDCNVLLSVNSQDDVTLDSLLINRKFGEYVLLQRLAVGGQSEVFLALKVGPGEFLRTVVIKALPSRLKEDERFLNLFFKEAFISSRFAHPNVITVHDAKLIEDDYCLVMDFVAGQTVADIAQRGFSSGRPITLNQAIQIIADSCDGLYYAHKFQDLDESTFSIVHCDISPQNLMVTYQGVTKVFDFGIAQIPGYESTNSPVTVGGKFAYMSPEQVRGEEVDARSDIFSLGIILYELCTGYRLFRRDSQAEVIKAVCEEPIHRPTELRPDLPIFLERCILRALERDPRKRYRNAAAMRDDLLQLLAMMSKGSERDELGQYVSSLFIDEQKHIANILRQANQGMLKLGQGTHGGSSHDFLPFDEQTMELDGTDMGLDALSEPNEFHIGPSSTLEEELTAELARKDSQLEEQRVALLDARQGDLAVSTLRKRQALLMVVIILLLAFCALFAYLAFGQGIA